MPDADDYIQLPDGRWRLKTPLRIGPIYVSFDDEDVDYLVSRFGVEELLREAHSAEVQEGVARLWAEDDAVVYWKEYGKLCRRALQETRTKHAKPVGGKFSVTAIKEAHNIIDVILGYSSLRKTGREYTGSCPFHEDKHPSLRVSEEKQLFYCFSCGRKGDVIDFISQVENTDTKGAMALLRNCDVTTPAEVGK